MKNIKILTNFLTIMTILLCANSINIFSVDTTGSGVKTINHECINLTLTSNWSSKEMPSNFAKETVAWLKWEKKEDASILIFHYKGMIYDYNNIRMKALNTIGANYPASQEMLKKPAKLETEGANRATIELWKGGINVNGKLMFLQSPMAILKIKNCWLIVIGFVSDAQGAEFEKDFIELVKSAR